MIVLTIKSIRGAITINKDTQEEIKNGTVELLTKIIEANELDLSDIIFVNFTATKDIKSAYPAKFAREELDFSNISMTCTQEMDVTGSLPLCIRVLVCFDCKTKKEIKHQYLKGAEKLRPDLK